MEPKEPKLDLSIREILRPHLAADGFTGSGKHFRREVPGWIHAINIQVSKYGGEFCINLGIHPAAVPTDFQPDRKKIREVDCEFRTRLAESGGDQWWSYENFQPSMDAAVNLATGVYVRIGRPYLAQFSEPHCPLTALRPDDLSEDPSSKFGFPLGVRAALVLGRLHKSQGRTELAHEFAKWGLARLGRATGLRAPFEELLAG
jgi:hypothetical protein